MLFYSFNGNDRMFYKNSTNLHMHFGRESGSAQTHRIYAGEREREDSRQYNLRKENKRNEMDLTCPSWCR